MSNLPKLNIAEIRVLKEYLINTLERVWFGKHRLTSNEANLSDTVEAQYNEVERLQKVLE